jgi:hypothetical protein
VTFSHSRLKPAINQAVALEFHVLSRDSKDRRLMEAFVVYSHHLSVNVVLSCAGFCGAVR